ncbi:hypothetical protein Dtox_4273 [Desulfofarcimen acetoxidans DSM 771]|jgi:putative mycofactocin binding protein MftB|uniref:Uncharacterized protein n=1 Tax=Desulfofarcimen acetoxidans (strain ATCC 49208 / DSM 771 / KCTC 5769 / VKM B-1644 / 5575) TaxID=485916 RepID=C8VZJ5_DESAS|nr:mycofactocin biosynthesis chaperone MftB [Desulfofarcimen acetoxidans]ACV64940.1 hypothetical protein Dtox_4273 [Desulfofarcimen acetoxidans DSM 771]
MDKVCYCLAPGYNARKESFGLLFYNTKTTKLNFVKAKGLLEQEFIINKNGVFEFPGENSAKQNTETVLKTLVKRGFLLERRLPV